jgi:two-component system response regulator MprA
MHSSYAGRISAWTWRVRDAQVQEHLRREGMIFALWAYDGDFFQQGESMPPTILVADDDPDILEVITTLLTQEGYQTIACANGLLALQQIALQRPALAIIDLSMPVMDGKEVILHLHQAPGPRLPVILMSASIYLPAQEKLQVEAYLAKPFDLEELLFHVLALAGQPEARETEEARASVFSRPPPRDGPASLH